MESMERRMTEHTDVWPKTAELFDLQHSSAAPLLSRTEYPWEALGDIKEFLLSYGQTLSPEEYTQPAPGVWISRRAKVAPTASISGPCIIEADAEIRHCAYIRGSALVGAGCVVGNSTELKNVILFDGVQVPHYNYVGDSILGYRSHLGAGSITSNVRSDKANVILHCGGERWETGLRKFGAMLGDRAEIGCNSVLCPGSIVGRDSIVYPLSRVRCVVPERSIFKDGGEIVPRIL